MTIISTGNKPNGTNTVDNTRPLSGGKASVTPLIMPAKTNSAQSSDPVSALMKELSVRNKTVAQTNGGSHADGQLVNGHSSQSDVSASMVRPASVHAGLGISANRNGDIQ